MSLSSLRRNKQAPFVSADESGPDLQRRPRDLRRFWRWALAVLAPLPMLAVAAQQVLTPYGLFASAQEQLAAGAASPSRMDAALWTGFLGVLLAFPATMAVAWSARRAAPRLALAGGVVSLVGFAMTWCIPSTAQLVRVAPDTGVDAGAAAAVIDLVAGHPSTDAAVIAFLSAQAVGLALLGVALWRTPTAPKWAAALLAVSGVAHVAMSGTPALAAASWLLTAVGYAGASVVLLHTANDDFDLPPTSAAIDTSITIPIDPDDDTHVGLPAAGAIQAGGHDVRRVWQWLLTVGAPVAAVYIAVMRYLLPFNTLDDARAAFDKLVAAPAFDAAQLWVGLMVAPFTLAGVMAVVWVSRRRSPVLTTVAGALCVLGYAALVSGGSPTNVIVAEVAAGRIDPEVGFRLSAATDALAQPTAAVSIFVIGHLLGTVLLGIALWRSGRVPRWIAAALAVSQPVHLLAAMTGNHPLDLMAWSVTAFGFGAAGLAALRMRPDEFDLRPARSPLAR